jgi:hypothetical protein
VSTKVRVLIGEDEVRFRGEEIDMLGTGIRVDEDHKVLRARDALGADFATKINVYVFPGIDRAILHSSGRRSRLLTSFHGYVHGSCEWSQSSSLIWLGNALDIEFSLSCM